MKKELRERLESLLEAACTEMETHPIHVLDDDDAAKYKDRIFRRNMEIVEKVSSTLIEDEKEEKISMKKVLLELGKVTLPVVISMIGYGIYQDRMLKFEETGSIRSSAAKDMHLPKFWR